MDKEMVDDSDGTPPDARHSQSKSTVDPEKPEAYAEPSDSTEETGTVLVVDDEPAITDAYAKWLTSQYDVRTAYSGSEAIAQLDGTIDVMLLDRRMPEQSGEDVLTEMYERGIDCRVAIISAEAPDDTIRELGYDSYLQKPVTERDQILGLVENLLTTSL